MIELKNVKKTFTNKIAVNDISFKVEEGEIFGFLGPNGAGKTTTINMIVGLLKPDGGEIYINGIDAIKNSFESKKEFSYVPDTPDVYKNMTGIQYLEFVSCAYRLDSNIAKERILKYSRYFEMEEKLPEFISGYSHGMKQKICLIGALISDPKVLILDEPMVGLDPKSAFNLKEVMRERCKENKSVFFSTHVLEVAEKICDRIAIIKDGNIIAIGTLEEIREKAKDEGSLEKIFLELTE